MLIMGALGGALFAAIPALLKAHFNTNEILTSLMLVYIAQLFLDWLIRGAWRNPQGFNFPETRAFAPEAMVPAIWEESGRAHWGFVFAIVAAVLVWFMMRYTLKGSRSPCSASRNGQGASPVSRRSRMIWFSFLLLRGACRVLPAFPRSSGSIEQLQPVISPGYGFTAIIVAFLGRLNPLGIIAAGLVLALTYLGGEAAQLSIGVSGQGHPRLPGTAALLRALLRHADPLQASASSGCRCGRTRVRRENEHHRSHSADRHHRRHAAASSPRSANW